MYSTSDIQMLWASNTLINLHSFPEIIDSPCSPLLLPVSYTSSASAAVWDIDNHKGVPHPEQIRISVTLNNNLSIFD